MKQKLRRRHLQSVRTRGGWTLTELAQRARVPASELGRWEGAGGEPTYEQALALAAALGIPATELYEWDEEDGLQVQRQVVLGQVQELRALVVQAVESLNHKKGKAPFCPERLREARKAQKCSQLALASWLGVTRQSVIRWENGETTPSRKMVQEVATLLKRPTAWFYQSATGFVGASYSEARRLIYQCWRQGLPIDDLAESSGLEPERVQRFVEGEEPDAAELQALRAVLGANEQAEHVLLDDEEVREELYRLAVGIERLFAE